MALGHLADDGQPEARAGHPAGRRRPVEAVEDVRQVVGWDPVAKTIRSWMFDSEGGFGEGVWSREDNRWTVRFHQILADGRLAFATNVYTYVDGNTFTWQSVGREVDGAPLPDVDPVTLVRKPAAEASAAASK